MGKKGSTIDGDEVFLLQAQLVEMEHLLSSVESEASEIDARQRETPGLRDDLSIDRLVDCLHWIQDRLEVIETRLVIIPPARPDHRG